MPTFDVAPLMYRAVCCTFETALTFAVILKSLFVALSNPMDHPVLVAGMTSSSNTANDANGLPPVSWT